MTAARIQTKLTRKDPVKRPVDGIRGRDVLVNADPGKHYVFAHRSNAFGEEYYASIGYELVLQSDTGGDGVRLRTGVNSKPGEPIEQFGHVLMSIDKALWMEMCLNGNEDHSGQAGVDAIEERIVDKTLGGMDGLRGLQTKFARVVDNQISTAAPMTE
jgi:hypothetical protein